MSDRNGYSGADLLLAAAAGAAVGAIAALLLAPRSGRETRERIAGLVDGAKARAENLPLAVRAGAAAAREAFVEAMDKQAPA
ncbi:MAG: YtxH domain-containing protein [Gemmatimonadaceae bacterium]|nr:YtxH domain-containing protein [Gemmatimonadaceae bacterium]